MTTINSTLATRLAVVLDLKAQAAPYDPTTNPLRTHTVEQVAGTTEIPAKNMAEQGGAGYDMEVARNENLRAGKKDRSKHRMQAARRRAAKKVEFDEIVNASVTPDSERMTEAWRVVAPLVPIATRIANEKRRWAERFLGSLVDDVPQIVLEQMALILAKSDKDLSLLRKAADELGEQAERKGIPGDQLSEDQRAERKQMAKARKWLMGMVNNRVMGALVDLYLGPENLRWQNIDMIATVMASISGVGSDPMMARFQADRAPAMLGSSFPKPGGIDHALVSVAINAAISELELDLLTEILLNEENRESGGSFRWTKNAEQVFLATPDGAWLWDLVCKATKHHARPRKARGEAAMMHARNQFVWMPDFIVQVVESFDPHLIGYSPTGGRAVLASDFELGYLPGVNPLGEERRPLVPALTYASVEQAVAALLEGVEIYTGAQFVNNLLNA